MELYVSVDELKFQVNLAREYRDEDEHLLELLEVAEMSIEKHIQQPLTVFVDESGKLNPMLRHAIRILVAHFYVNREPVAYGQPHIIPYTIEYLLQPFKKYT